MDKPENQPEGAVLPTDGPFSTAPLRPALPGESANLANVVKCKLCGRLYLRRHLLRVEQRGAPDTTDFCSRDHAVTFWRLYHPRTYDAVAGAAAVVEWRAYREAHKDEIAARKVERSENLKKAHARRAKRLVHDRRPRRRPGRKQRPRTKEEQALTKQRRVEKLAAIAKCPLCAAGGKLCRAHR